MNTLVVALQTRSPARRALAALIVVLASSTTGMAHAQLGTSNGATSTSGPTAVEAPPPPRGPNDQQPEAAGGDAAVHFVPASPDLVLSIRRGEVAQTGRVLALRTIEYYGTTYKPIFETLCEGECTRTFQMGTQRLALGKKGGTPIEPSAPILINGPSTVRGDFIDRSGQRTTGTAIAVIGGGAGLIVGGYEFITGDNAAIGFAGVGVLLTSLIVGSLIALAHDETIFTVTPLGSGASASRESGYAPAAVQRGGLSFRF